MSVVTLREFAASQNGQFSLSTLNLTVGLDGDGGVAVRHSCVILDEVNDDVDLVLCLIEVCARRAAGLAAAAGLLQVLARREVEPHAHLLRGSVSQGDVLLGPLGKLLGGERRNGSAGDGVTAGIELLDGAERDLEEIIGLNPGEDLELWSLAHDLDLQCVGGGKDLGAHGEEREQQRNGAEGRARHGESAEREYRLETRGVIRRSYGTVDAC